MNLFEQAKKHLQDSIDRVTYSLSEKWSIEWMAVFARPDNVMAEALIERGSDVAMVFSYTLNTVEHNQREKAGEAWVTDVRQIITSKEYALLTPQGEIIHPSKSYTTLQDVVSSFGATLKKV